MTITCQNCGGKGYTVNTGWDGIKRPTTCKGCNGTGQQKVRP